MILIFLNRRVYVGGAESLPPNPIGSRPSVPVEWFARGQGAHHHDNPGLHDPLWRGNNAIPHCCTTESRRNLFDKMINKNIVQTLLESILWLNSHLRVIDQLVFEL